MVPSRQRTRLPTNDYNFNEKKRNRRFLHDDDILNDLEYKVVNIANYFGNGDRLVGHIKEVNLTFIEITDWI